MTKLQNVEAHNGLEAWRQLVLEFEPRTPGRKRLHLTSLLRPAKTNNMEKLGETIEQWEREVRDYERVRKEALDEEIKIGGHRYLAPDKVSENLFLFADKLQSYADARKVVFEFVDAHRAQHTASAAVPLDVDALTQEGGKGKDRKGCKHGGQEGRKYKGKEKFAGECWICGKAGHKSSECWHKDKKGKDGGKGGLVLVVGIYWMECCSCWGGLMTCVPSKTPQTPRNSKIGQKYVKNSF
eukprot:5968099-Amphidinium_carterae.1